MILYTYFVYALLILGVFVLSLFIGLKKQGHYITRYCGFVSVLLILFFSLIDGCRYKVGYDWLQYKDIFVHLQQTGNFSRDKLEFFYKFINLLLAEVGLHYAFLFMLMSGILLFSLLFLLRDFRRHLWCVIPLFICWFLNYSDNLSRQFLAISFLLIAMYYYVRQKYQYSIVLVIFATGCHITALSIAPIYLILFYVNLRKYKYFPLCLYGVCFIISIVITTAGFNILSSEYTSFFLILIGRESYIERIANAGFNSFDIEIHTRIIMGFFHLFILYQVTKLKDIENERLFNWIFNIYILGICLWDLFCEEELFQRFILYLYCCFPFIWGIILSKVIRRHKLVTSAITLLIIAYSIRRYFIFSSLHGSFNFIWDIQ